MSKSVVETGDTSVGVYLKPWEFYAFVMEAFLLIAAAAAVLGLTRRADVVLSKVVFASGIVIVIGLALLPVQSVLARHYNRRNINVAWMTLWPVFVAIVAGSIAFFAH